jgi:hypothetical protein
MARVFYLSDVLQFVINGFYNGPGIGLGKTKPKWLKVLRITINIEGGVVTATGGEDGAGIGAGEADVQFMAPAMIDSTGYEIMGSVLLIILPTFELLQTKHQLVLTVVGFLPPKRA